MRPALLLHVVGGWMTVAVAGLPASEQQLSSVELDVSAALRAELEQLRELHNDGLLSDQVYEARQHSLLDTPPGEHRRLQAEPTIVTKNTPAVPSAYQIVCDETVTTQTGTQPGPDYDPIPVPVYSSVHTTLATKVNGLLAQGWQPIGGILSGQSDPNSARQVFIDTTPQTNVSIRFCQAMVKYK